MRLGSREFALALAATLVTLAGVEGVARAWVRLRWPKQKVYELTHLTETRGRFRSHPTLPYTLTPSFDSRGFHQNRLGFRGPELRLERTPQVPRVALLGASTVYAIYARDGETAADVLGRELAQRGKAVEVVNAGVPGWTSRETIVSLGERVLPLHPDVIVVMDGRNEVFPELFRHFAPDYSHYRVPHYEVRLTNAGWKRAFRWSHALMAVISRGELLGFSMRAEHPDYGSVRLDNMPTPDEALRNARDPSRYTTFQENLREVIREARAHQIVPVLAIVPFRFEGWRSGVLDNSYVPAVREAMARNLALVRSLAANEHLALVDTDDLLRPEWMADDCHFNPRGEAALARRYADVLWPLLTPPANAP